MNRLIIYIKWLENLRVLPEMRWCTIYIPGQVRSQISSSPSKEGYRHRIRTGGYRGRKSEFRLEPYREHAFYAGDMKDILTQDFINQHGRPDVIITDPPRAGMHDDVINTILFAEPERIVYVSCNPATQARDLSLLSVKYSVKKKSVRSICFLIHIMWRTWFCLRKNKHII